MYTLAVIDMQRNFDSSLEPRLNVNVAREISNAIANQASILFVEYSHEGHTHFALRQLVKTYRQFFTIDKHQDDGSEEIVKAISKYSLHRNRIRVCGVNTGACVLHTLYGLNTRSRASIEVVEDACWDNYEECHIASLKEIRKNLPAIKIV